jgi:competence protein ComGC
MDVLLIILLVLAVLILVAVLFLKKKELPIVQPLPELYRQLLKEHVNFYNQSDDVKKTEFEYFFERSDLLQINHPLLYELLTTIFRQQPQKPERP